MVTDFQHLPENRAILVVDGRSLCWQIAMLSLKRYPELSDADRISSFTGLYFSRLMHFANRYNTGRFVFAWEGHAENNLRKKLYDGYKANRVLNTDYADQEILPEDAPYVKKRKARCNAQNKLMRLLKPFWVKLQNDIIPALGFKNSFSFEGFEGDDIIAKICQKYSSKYPIVIISDDSDMYQLISDNVALASTHISYSEKQHRMLDSLLLTKAKFIRKFEISPEKWAEVKAISGCHTDCVPGIMGIGFITAVRYLNGDSMVLKSGKVSKKRIAIDEAYKDGRVDFSRKLVKLPLDGVPDIVLDLNESRSMKSAFAVLDTYGVRDIDISHGVELAYAEA